MSRVLVVEDDESIAEVMRLALEGEGYHVRTAANGREALEAADGGTRLVLLDMLMPVMDGWQFARAYRERGGRAPIVVVTAAADAAHRAREISADGVLAKPFGLGDLVATVQRFLERD